MFNTLANVTGHMSSTTVIARSDDSAALGAAQAE
jgi:Na+/H+-dicarboxylate symporter